MQLGGSLFSGLHVESMVQFVQIDSLAYADRIESFIFLEDKRHAEMRPERAQPRPRDWCVCTRYNLTTLPDRPALDPTQH